MKKRNIVIAVIALIVIVLILILGSRGCDGRNDPPQETEASQGTEAILGTEASQGTEPSAVPTEGGKTEPTEPKPPTETTKPTQPQATEPKPIQSKPTEPKPSEPAPTAPKPTEPLITEPPATEPKPTNPPATEPAPTEPAGCDHEWVCIHHDEEGHWLAGVICDCGWTAYGDPDEIVSAWEAHIASFPLEEALLNHGGFGSAEKWIVEKPAYDEWVCRYCGVPKP